MKATIEQQQDVGQDPMKYLRAGAVVITRHVIEGDEANGYRLMAVTWQPWTGKTNLRFHYAGNVYRLCGAQWSVDVSGN